MAKQIAQPIIAEQIPKYKIDSVDFETLTLGCLPPTFQGFTIIFIFHLRLHWIYPINVWFTE